MTNVRTAVIPAAGFGTRFLPISKAIPKEMLPIVDRPAIQYTIEQALDAGIDRIVLVTSRGKTPMEDYFDIAPDLEATLERRKHAKLDEVRRISRMADIVTVRQKEQRGLGHAVLCAKEAVGDNPFVVFLPDDIIVGPAPSVTRQLIDVYGRRGSVIAVQEVPMEQVSSYGVVAGEQVGEREWRLREVVEKPPRDKAPSNLAIVSQYIFSPEIFAALERITEGAIGELQLTDAIQILAKGSGVHAYKFNGTRYDCGTPLGLLQASVELALERPDMRDRVKAWLAGLNAKLGQPTG
ncbi:MAG: UTP--glucose-1-phosphate uridylyltransferase GalU [SAR202 cluster bacterium]|nr:UTP--glucose-1-phosphate uridylyltransferase GalU [SAR202 cluster bacterium]